MRALWTGLRTAVLGIVGLGLGITAACSSSDREGSDVGTHDDAIVGGSVIARDRAYPWMASILQNRGFSGPPVWEHVCGGVLVAPNYVMTGAHCAVEYDVDWNISGDFVPANHFVMIGLADQRDGKRIIERQGADNRNVFTVERVYLHPEWNKDISWENDIALLKLTANAPQPALAYVDSVEEESAAATPGDKVRVLGWGETRKDVPFEDVTIKNFLRSMDVRLWSNAECAPVWLAHDGTVINDRELCAGGGSKDACFGDSGGPLFARTRNGAKLLGLVAFGGETCAIRGLPGGYTRLGTMGAWATRCMANPSTCATP